jgi:hypothetical protein
MVSCGFTVMCDRPQSVTFECREFMFQTMNLPSHPAGF